MNSFGPDEKSMCEIRRLGLTSILQKAGFITLIMVSVACQQERADRNDWPVYKADANSSSYSSLDQINKENVDRLEGAWTYRTGDIEEDEYEPDSHPQLLNESTSSLISYLDHPNGWWRDNAQKLIVLRDDRSVVPALKRMAVGEKTFFEKLQFWKPGPSPLGRIHALWTLDGLNAIDESILFRAFKDEDPKVRKTAIWISERYLKENNLSIIENLEPLVRDTSMDVRIQLSLSLRYSTLPKAKELIGELLSSNRENEMLAASWKEYKETEQVKSLNSKVADMSEQEKNLISKGATIFSQSCSTCHGPDGKGITAGKDKSMVAPSLTEKSRISGDKDLLIKILLHGLTGPVDGIDYPDVMPAMDFQSNEWVASVLSYLRNDFGNRASVVTPDEVEAIRIATAGKEGPWTLEELE